MSNSTFTTEAGTINDESGSGYFDIGNMRIQWGMLTTYISTVTLPAAYGDANYTVNVTGENGRFGAADTHTTAGFRIIVTNSAGNTTPTPARWMSVGIIA